MSILFCCYIKLFRDYHVHERDYRFFWRFNQLIPIGQIQEHSKIIYIQRQYLHREDTILLQFAGRRSELDAFRDKLTPSCLHYRIWQEASNIQPAHLVRQCNIIRKI
jgi:hypothetical protein